MTTQDDSGTHAHLADSGDNTNSQALPRGSNLGRYVIIEPIGSGGMGTVYRAYDPQLNRGVALKILSVKQDDFQAAERAKARLIREAQALAQLSHPNVVAVHDAGTFEDDVFIAMELVEGKTLDEWLKEEKRNVKEILKVMIAAGRGLSAAHKAGLIHRDFKPGNVIVGDDGRVRVLDFGLARAAVQHEPIKDTELDPYPQEQVSPFDLQEISSDSSPDLLHSPLTHVGGVLGTPMYMAPEQHLGLKTDARTDQFGFCVVLYKSLYGKRPYAARSIKELKLAIIRQQIRIQPASSDVPVWLWQIMRKGLSADPKNRHPTLESLLEELEYDPEEVHRQQRVVRRRKLLLFSLVVLTIVLPIGVWYGLRYRTFQLCKAAEVELVGVWDDATKASVKTAFLGTEKSYALGTWERVEQTFKIYLADWTQMRSDVCEARLIRGTQSEELFDLRMGCLKKRVVELGALAKVFSGADAGVVQKAVQASASLTGIASCADEEALRSLYPPPKTKEAKAKVTAIRDRLSRVEALRKTGKYREGLALARKLKKEANAVDYGPVQAEALYWLGDLLEETGEYKEAETALYGATIAAAKSRDILLVAKAMARIAWIVGYKLARSEEGLSLSRFAEAVIDFGGRDAILLSRLYSDKGVIFETKGEYGKALHYYRQALAIRLKVLGKGHPLVAISLNNMGLMFMAQGHYDKAHEYLNRTLSIFEKTLGPEHPYFAVSQYNLGEVFSKQGLHEKALEYFHEGLAILETALGPEHPNVVTTLGAIGNTFSDKGEYDKALKYLRKAVASREISMGPEHPLLSGSLNSIGNILIDQGMPQQALKPFERVLRICEKKTCGSEAHGGALYGLSQALVTTDGDKQRAIKLAQQSLELFRKTPKRFKKELEEVTTWLQKHGNKKIAKKAPK